MTDNETQIFIDKWVVVPFTSLMNDVKDEIKILREKTHRLNSTISSLESVFGIIDSKIHQTKEDAEHMRNTIDNILKIQTEQTRQVITIQEQMKVMANNSSQFDKKIDELSKTINAEIKDNSNSFSKIVKSKEFWIMIGLAEFLFSGQFALVSHFFKV
jgi:chromosome segregation ATPase